MSDKINPESWHYKLYVFNTQLIGRWGDDEEFYLRPHSRRRKIGLCPYVRTIMLWGPLVMASYVLPIGAFLGVVVFLPGGLAGTAGILGLISVFVAMAALAVGIGYLTKWINTVHKIYVPKKSELATNYDDDGYPIEIERPATFWTILKDYIIAAKTKVCPVLTLPEDN